MAHIPDSFPPSGSGVPDPYAGLLARTRRLSGAQRAARDAWLANLRVEGKEELLFELEVLLKATACFANPRNHPGTQRRTPVVAQDFHAAAVHFRDGLRRALNLTRTLLRDRDRAFVFHRYLESVLPEDLVRTRLVTSTLEQQTPEESLLRLRGTLTTALEVTEGGLRTQRIPYRYFYALCTMVQREVSQNTFFNPLVALEFRPEFDRIHSTQVLALLGRLPGAEAHRLVALTFLSLFRMLRYLRLVERIAVEPAREGSAGRGYMVLAVLRSDARALSEFLRRHAGKRLAHAYQEKLLEVPASQLQAERATLLDLGKRSLRIAGALDGIAQNLHVEMRRAFHHDLPTLDQGGTEVRFRAALRHTTETLRPALQTEILFLGKALGSNLQDQGVFADPAALRETSDRLRRDVWMFSRIAAAFSEKTQQAPPRDSWLENMELRFVQDFISYFRSMGYPLLRAGDSPRFDSFLEALEKLTSTDLVSAPQLSQLQTSSWQFHEYLEELFENISKRECLAHVPFDRRAAAHALRTYVSDERSGEAGASR